MQTYIVKHEIVHNTIDYRGVSEYNNGMLKSKPKTPTDAEILEAQAILDEADVPTQGREIMPGFKAIDHIKPTKEVTKVLDLWLAAAHITRRMNTIRGINHNLPAAKAAQYQKRLTELNIHQFNANGAFNHAYNKLKNYQMIEFRLRLNELNAPNR